MWDLKSKLQQKLLPGFKSGHTRYVEFVKAYFKDGCRWLDAGGGRRIFPDLYDGERELVQRARTVTVCDADSLSLQDHVSISNRMCCSLADISLPDNCMDFITCAMVIEHLEFPSDCLRELARILDDGGCLIIHTPNLWGYPTVLARLSKLIPSAWRRRIISRITGRQEEDIFPTHYNCNTGGSLSKSLEKVGLDVTIIHYLDSAPLFGSFLPVYVLELLYLRLTSLARLRFCRGQLVVVAVKRRSRDRADLASAIHSLSAGSE
jgi:SAM-dependent methyltransferase